MVKLKALNYLLANDDRQIREAIASVIDPYSNTAYLEAGVYIDLIISYFT